jgi:hypothetical protein
MRRGKKPILRCIAFDTTQPLFSLGRGPVVPESLEASTFLANCEKWLCDDYFVDTRYVATDTPAGPVLFDAFVAVNPLAHAADRRLSVSVGPLLAGQEQASSLSKNELLVLLARAVAGTITIGGQEFTLPKDGNYRYQSTAIDRNTWFMPLTLQIWGAASGGLLQRPQIDNELRAGLPPFDGADDLRLWLDLRLPTAGYLSTITLAINPPVDLRIDRSALSDGTLRLALHAHPKVNRSEIRLAVCAAPGDGLIGRVQVADKIVWGEIEGDRIEGTLEIKLANATGALVMLLVGPDTVRRNWFLDLAKSPNHRFAAVQQFDSDLRMIRRALFEDPDPSRFETGVGALVFLLGFSPSVQLETDSPDLIVASPVGRLILVECTTRVADLITKLGKLVDRRQALIKKLQDSGVPGDVSAALVCRLPRDQIAVHAGAVKSMRVVLLAAEDITDGLNRARLPSNPDELLLAALATLDSPNVAQGDAT